MIIGHRKLRAHKRHICDDCKHPIQLMEYYYRLFGCAEKGDPPYELKICTTCHEAPYIRCEKCNEAKVI